MWLLQHALCGRFWDELVYRILRLFTSHHITSLITHHTSLITSHITHHITSHHSSLITHHITHHSSLITHNITHHITHHITLITFTHHITHHTQTTSHSKHTTYHIPINQLIVQVLVPVRQVVLPHRLHVEVQSLEPVLERLPRLHLLQRRLCLTHHTRHHIERRLARIDQHLFQFNLTVLVAL